MKYHLSNRQQKEIANGKAIRVALPLEGFMDAQSRDAAMKRARQLLDIPADTIVYRAECHVLPVNPLQGGTGLNDVFGTILHDHIIRNAALIIRIECVVATVIHKGRELRGRYPTQWPGSVTLDDGTRLP